MIVDASAFVASIGSIRTARALRSVELAAPDLLIPETLNAFWKLARAGESIPERPELLALLDAIRILPSRPYAVRAAELAEEVDHPVYDCLYLAVAEVEGDVLATADRRFVAKITKRSLRRRLHLIS
jgi:predicted nucleic acid-binding protein